MNVEIYSQKISNKKDLDLTINFLKNGFNWSEKQALTIYKKIIFWNPKDIPYGFIFRDNLTNELIGAILTHYQGAINFDDDLVKVVNLSWWYVNPKERGIRSIYMAKQICLELEGCIITNFSSNKNAYTIFKAIGFKEINTYTTNFYLPQYLIYHLKLGIFKKIKITQIQENHQLHMSSKFLKKDSFEITLKIKKVKLNLLLTRSKVEKAIFKFKISIPRIHIIWSSDNEILVKNYHLILGHLMLRYFCPIISTHCLSYSLNKVFKVWTKHIIFSPYTEIDSLISIGSENSISLL